MRFGVLGPLDVRTGDGTPVRVPERKVRVLLADLLAHRGRPVSADRLVTDLWGDDGPANPLRALHAKVSQLRRALEEAEPGGRDLVESRSPGYLLRADDVDADRFAELTARAREAVDPTARAALLADALDLWRGPAFADFADHDFTRSAITRLDEQRLVAVEDLAQARLELGEHAAVVAELADIVAEHPLRERLRAIHLRALYRSGRQHEALAGYDDLRRRLADELGVDPSPELAALHRAMLEQDADLAPPVRPTANLPNPLTPLVGREHDVAEVRRLLGEHRLVTLTGPGGVGKTRLAVEAARRLVDGFADGVRIVEVSAPCSLPDVVAAVLGIRDDGTWGGEHVDTVDRLGMALRDKRMLLVLDNCEQMIPEVAALTAHVLRTAPHLRVLATSQEPLAVAGEVRHPVAPLAEPAAVELFVARATAAAPGSALDADAVAAICRRLDGLPLALELAATKVRALGVIGVLSRLDDRFRVLAGGYRDAPPRQRTLRAMIDWSWELLDDAARVVLRRLAVHHEGCTFEAAEAVCGGDDVLDVLTGLVDRSLVVVVEGAGGPRYRLLESVAAYCVERLGEAGELEDVRARHVEYYTDLAERARLRGPGQHEWLRRLDADSANLRVALDHAVRQGLAAQALRLVDALAWYWVLRGRLGEARRAFETVHTVGRTGATTAWHTGIGILTGQGADRDARIEAALRSCPEPHAFWFLGHALCEIGDVASAEHLTERALTTFAATGDRWGTAAALSDRALQRLLQGDLEAAARDGERSVALFHDLGDTWGRLRGTRPLAAVAEVFGDYDEAAERLRTGLRLAEQLGLWPEASDLIAGLGRIALLAGDHERAREHHERALDLAAEHGFRAGEANARLGLALGARRAGNLDTAEELLYTVLAWHDEVGLSGANALVLAELGFIAELRADPTTAAVRHRESYAAAVGTGDPRALALALEGLAGASGDPASAATLLGAADAARRSRNAPLPAAERADVDRITGRVMEVLGTVAFGEHFAHGATLTPDQALDYSDSRAGVRKA
ncbi:MULTISPECIES: BTAD domain-containing putative transcriptional regulator [Saccharothrix]|uniref:BTAD domain-containing putative transcriptional regulator n=1 Tax=Saccharothrix TaxID=2071 RepID=UPI00093DE32A|nr:BTAD domain-containing putative transcriptional regulator [Saccharothrix sp. CB00851]OKI27050.1 ATPase [Saccharothrix sp. CB00851]